MGCLLQLLLYCRDLLRIVAAASGAAVAHRAVLRDDREAGAILCTRQEFPVAFHVGGVFRRELCGELESLCRTFAIDRLIEGCAPYLDPGVVGPIGKSIV